MEEQVVNQIRQTAYFNWETRNKLKVPGNDVGDWLAAYEAVVNKNDKFLVQAVSNNKSKGHK